MGRAGMPVVRGNAKTLREELKALWARREAERLQIAVTGTAGIVVLAELLNALQ
jgi:predicted nucleic acid-binding protein